MEFYYLPQLFIISLNRFKCQGSYYFKNKIFVEFPLKNMDLNQFVCGFNKNNNIYDCFAICQHFGEMEGGHYTAICKNIDEKWYYYDDETCSVCEENNIISSAAYIIFFRRKKN
jgi:ubiquitin carboxyl-terminal hydrolase 4/11/15